MTVPKPGPPPRPADPRPVDSRLGDSRLGDSRVGDLRVGDPRAAVDSALAGLDGLAERPLAEHVEAFERVHTALSDALAAGTSGVS
jgi:hypothetical protein